MGGNVVEIAGSVLAVLAGIAFVWSLYLLIAGGRAVGTVTGFSYSASTEGGRVKKPVVRFAAADGREHEFADFVSTFGLDVGDRVPVRYRPWNPDKGRIATPVRIFWIPVVFALVATMLLYVGNRFDEQFDTALDLGDSVLESDEKRGAKKGRPAKRP